MNKLIMRIQKKITVIIKHIKSLTMKSLCMFIRIDNKKIIMMAYGGTKYSCNPKALSEYIIKNSTDYKIYWGFNNRIYNTIEEPFIEKLRIGTLRFYFHYYTSKFIISNERLDKDLYKRKKQFYIQTWHGYLALKAIEKDASEYLSKAYISKAKKDSKYMNLLLSSSELTTKQYKQCFWYDGPIMEKGTPRNDIFFKNNDNLIKDIKKKLDISNYKIVLYAPTFRNKENIDFYKLDSDLIVQMLNKRFGGEWILLYRLHPNLISKFDKLEIGNNAINVSYYNDMQELLLISDMLITDVSSSIFDYMLTNKPCILYLKEIENYLKEERPLNIKLEEIPFPKAYDFYSLIKEINEFDYEIYVKSIKNFKDKIKNYEKGTASKDLLEYISNLNKKYIN